MRRSWAVVVLGVGCVGSLSGCVDRRYVVTTNVPGAQVFVDGTAIGPAPVDNRYDYAGWREMRAVAPGYEPTVRRVQFKPRWYDYPGLDLFAEVIWPFRIEDVRRVDLILEPQQPQRNDELQMKAEELRARGAALPPPSVPNDLPSLNGRPTPPLDSGIKMPAIAPPLVTIDRP